MATIKQKRVVDNLVVNGGNITQAMRDAGYAKSIVNKTEKVTRSKGFKELTKPIIKQFEDHRRMALKRAEEVIDTAQYQHLIEAADKFTKLIQLLSGDATERTEVKIEGIEYIVPDENKNMPHI